MMNTHQYEHGVSDLIQATALVDDGIIALKDGGLLAGWRYTGTNNMEAAEVVRDRFAAVLDYGKGWVLETNAIRLPSTTYPAWGEFPDPVSRLIEAERVRNYTVAGRYFETQYYITLAYFPPSHAGEKAKGWFYETPVAQGLAEQALDYFRTRIAAFDSLCSGFLQMKALQSEGDFDPLLRYIQLCITGEDRLFLKPDTPIDLDFLLGGVDLHGGSKPLIDGRPLRVLAIDPMPQAIYPAMLRSLEQLPMPFRLHGRAILLDRTEAAELHEYNKRRHNSKVTPFLAKVFKIESGHINQRAAELAADANVAASMTEDLGQSWGHYSARVILIRDTEEEITEAIDAVRSCAEQSHLKIRVETLNVNDAWCGSLPGHAFFDIRQVPLRAFNIAGMSPLQATWTGYQHHPSPKMPPESSPLLVATGEGMTPYRHHLHVQDVGHTAVFGPTGNGKTTIFGLHAVSLLRYPAAQVVMFDRNRTQYVLCRALGGRYYDFGDKSLELCPLQAPGFARRNWLGPATTSNCLCSMNGLTVTATHTDRIGKALERFARSKKRSLTHFAGAVGDLEIQAALQFYTIGNPVSARLLDGEDESIADSHFTVFEMAELMQMNRRISMAVQMHLFRRIERKLNPSRITGIFLDEARRMIGDDLFAGTIENWLKEIRNLNGFVMLALQEIEDGQGSKLRSVIEQQCKTKIFLPNPGARAEHTRQAYTALGITPAQIQQIAQGRAKNDYFVSTPDHWTRISFDIEQVALAFLSANTPQDRALVDRLMADNPESWQADFLRSRGLHDWADYLEHLRKMEEV